jgi:predicted translin family RNA/ssDNA-binding protein
VAKSKPIFADLLKVVPKGEYFRYNSFWSSKSTQLVCDLAFAYWLLKNELITLEKTREIITDELTLDDYLFGISSITGELSRLTMNLVIRGDYKTPVKIDVFLKDFYNGFKLMNLKNDGLRKKFDGMKYDIKKVEQVIYDLAINKLLIN